jgi:hypothetical protein
MSTTAHGSTSELTKEDHTRDDLSAPSAVRVERGEMLFRKHLRCIVCGEQSHLGLLSLKGNDWSTIYLVEHEITDCVWHTLVINKLGKRVVKITAAEIGEMSKVSDVILGCGSAPIVDSLIRLARTTLPAIVIPSECPRRDRKRYFSSFSVRWTRHSALGGATTWKGTVCTKNWSRPLPSPRVQRNLGHMIDHGVRCKPSSRLQTLEFLDPLCLLPTHRKTLLLLYPTHSTGTGWGSRDITNSEIGHAFDLPLWFLMHSEGLQEWLNENEAHQVPMKVFHTVLDDFIALQPRRSAPNPTHLMRAPIADLNIVTFPGISKPLQPIWSTFGTITAKAVKSDDAKIDTMMWDSRVTLVLPISSRVLNRLRACIMGHWAKLAYKSFRRYLLLRYGSTWVSQLLQARRDRVTAARFEVQRSTDYRNGPPTKRQKRSHCRGRDREVSVCSPSEDGKSAEPAAKRLRGGCPPPASIPAKSLSELVADTDAGVDVLSQVLGGT